MRKQSMSLMLAALMIGGSLAGCSGSKPAETTAASTEAAKTEAAETTAETTAGAEAKDVKLTFTWWGTASPVERLLDKTGNCGSRKRTAGSDSDGIYLCFGAVCG